MSRDEETCRFESAPPHRRKHCIFGGPELLKISKAIDLRRQSVEYTWTRAVGPPTASTCHVLKSQLQQTFEKAGFKMAWEGG